MSTAFSSVPVLDWSLVERGQRAEFVQSLRHALINVGFLYLLNPPIAPDILDGVIRFAPELFALPQSTKDKYVMRNSPHFFGYNRLGSELTKGAIDYREQWDFATDYESKWAPGKPEYLRLWGPAQWPSNDELPGFKATFSTYLSQVQVLGNQFIVLIAEALDLLPGAFDKFFNAADEGMQHRSKIVKYPGVDPVNGNQGVGPHFDGGFLTFLLQATNHRGLQVQNPSGEWIDASPRPNTLVVNIGKGLETVTQGVALATSHRVLSPESGSIPRYSVPFFQNISQGVILGENTVDIPEHILRLKEQRGVVGKTESVNFSEYTTLPSGLVTLVGRVKSHPDVAEKHYPDLFEQIFPHGAPALGSAY